MRVFTFRYFDTEYWFEADVVAETAAAAEALLRKELYVGLKPDVEQDSLELVCDSPFPTPNIIRNDRIS